MADIIRMRVESDVDSMLDDIDAAIADFPVVEPVRRKPAKVLFSRAFLVFAALGMPTHCVPRFTPLDRSSLVQSADIPSLNVEARDAGPVAYYPLRIDGRCLVTDGAASIHGPVKFEDGVRASAGSVELGHLPFGGEAWSLVLWVKPINIRALGRDTSHEAPVLSSGRDLSWRLSYHRENRDFFLQLHCGNFHSPRVKMKSLTWQPAVFVVGKGCTYDAPEHLSVFLSRRPGTRDGAMRGHISDVAFWCRQLTHEEVTEILGMSRCEFAERAKAW